MDRREESSSPSVREQKRVVKKSILERSLTEDQDAVRQRWVDTLLHENTDRRGKFVSSALLFTFCLIRHAKFEVSTSGPDVQACDFRHPDHALQVADYLSHASRIIIDTENLSPAHRENVELIFGKAANQLYHPVLESRASTHALERDKHGAMVELKSQAHGTTELLKTGVQAIGSVGDIAGLARNIGIAGPASTDYGVDVSMGGFHKPNLIGQVSDLGKDGHVLIHHPAEGMHGIMVGLEQSRPITSLDMTNVVQSGISSAAHFISSIWAPSPSPKSSAEETFSDSSSIVSSEGKSSTSHNADDDPTHGLSGEHSWTGASDEYTAAGSLYFSNPLYQMKLLSEQGVETPKKYNGMRIVLSDDDFRAAHDAWQQLRQNRDENLYQSLLSTRPAYASTEVPDEIQRKNNFMSFLSKMSSSKIKAIFKQVSSVLPDDHLAKTKLEKNFDHIKGLFKIILPWVQYIQSGTMPDDVVEQSKTHLLEGDMRQINVNMLQGILNDAVIMIRQHVIEDFKQRIESDEGQAFLEQANTLRQQYRILEDCELTGTHLELSNHIQSLYRLSRVLNNYGRRFNEPGTAACPLQDYQKFIQNYEAIADILKTNEARIILKLVHRVNELENGPDHKEMFNEDGGYQPSGRL